MHFANKFLFAHEKKSDEECAFALWVGITGVTSRPIFLHSIRNVIMSILYHYTSSYTNAFPNSRYPPPKEMTACIVFRLLTLRCKSFITLKKIYILFSVASPSFLSDN